MNTRNTRNIYFHEEISKIPKTHDETRKSVHRTRMPPPNAIQKKGLYVIVTGIP